MLSIHWAFFCLFFGYDTQHSHLPMEPITMKYSLSRITHAIHLKVFGLTSLVVVNSVSQVAMANEVNSNTTLKNELTSIERISAVLESGSDWLSEVSKGASSIDTDVNIQGFGGLINVPSAHTGFLGSHLLPR